MALAERAFRAGGYEAALALTTTALTRLTRLNAQPLNAALTVPAQQLANETAAQLELLPDDDVCVMTHAASNPAHGLL